MRYLRKLALTHTLQALEIFHTRILTIIIGRPFAVSALPRLGPSGGCATCSRVFSRNGCLRWDILLASRWSKHNLLFHRASLGKKSPSDAHYHRAATDPTIISQVLSAAYSSSKGHFVRDSNGQMVDRLEHPLTNQAHIREVFGFYDTQHIRER